MQFVSGLEGKSCMSSVIIVRFCRVDSKANLSPYFAILTCSHCFVSC